MGFKSSHITMLLFARVLKWYPLKPMQIPASPQITALKPTQIATTKRLETHRIIKIQLKPTCIATVIAPEPSATGHEPQLPTDSPSVREAYY